MVVQYIERKLKEKSRHHQTELKRLGIEVANEHLFTNIHMLDQTPQVKGMSTIIQDVTTTPEDFIFYFDRLAALLIEQ